MICVFCHEETDEDGWLDNRLCQECWEIYADYGWWEMMTGRKHPELVMMEAALEVGKEVAG